MMHPSQLQPVTRRMWMLQNRRSQNRPLSLPSWTHSTCDRSRTPTLWVPPKADGRGVECHNQTPLGTRPHPWPPGGGGTGWLFPPHTAAWAPYLPPQPPQPSNLWSPLSVPPPRDLPSCIQLSAHWPQPHLGKPPPSREGLFTPAFLVGLALTPRLWPLQHPASPQLLESCLLLWAQLLLVCGASVAPQHLSLPFVGLVMPQRQCLPHGWV